MVRRLLGAGHDVSVVARRPEVRAACVEAGATATGDLAEGVRGAAAVVVCLYSDAQLRELAPALLAAMDDGALLVIHTTGSPATSQRLADEGARVVEAPVSGSAEDIAAGQVTVLLAGEPADVDEAHEVVAAYGDPILRVGPLGAAQTVKLLNNTLLSAHLQLIAEVERISADLGVDWAPAVEALQASSGASRALEIVQMIGSVEALMEAGGHFLRKDVTQAFASAAEAGIDLGQLAQVNLAGPVDLVDLVD
jgi:3-hydroxyisobutyrate dehydrogenase-like beta-hydroxyacid dehydrogenase